MDRKCANVVCQPPHSWRIREIRELLSLLQRPRTKPQTKMSAECRVRSAKVAALHLVPRPPSLVPPIDLWLRPKSQTLSNGSPQTCLPIGKPNLRPSTTAKKQRQAKKFLQLSKSRAGASKEAKLSQVSPSPKLPTAKCSSRTNRSSQSDKARREERLRRK